LEKAQQRRRKDKHEIWKAELKELNNKGTMKGRQILTYYRFGSWRKRKKRNYMMKLSDKTINEI
jgi:hypothetical protein